MKRGASGISGGFHTGETNARASEKRIALTTMGTRIATKRKSDEDRDKDRDDDGSGADMPEGLGHEKRRVYQRGLDYVTWSHPVLAGIQPSAVVLDHWACEAVGQNDNKCGAEHRGRKRALQ